MTAKVAMIDVNQLRKLLTRKRLPWDKCSKVLPRVKVFLA
jgi:hypothetical protein